MRSIAFFNNKGGVGKTTLIYHLAWSYVDLGLRVLVVDLDPQANLTAFCVDEARLEVLWEDDTESRQSIFACIRPVQEELGDIRKAEIEPVSPSLGLLVGDLQLASFEAKLSDAWSRAVDRHAPSFRALTAFHRLSNIAADEWDADLVLIDVGPNLGALNRAALIAAAHVVVPLGADLFSIQALRNLGPTLNEWRHQWQERLQRKPDQALDAPEGSMHPAGYVVMQPNLYSGTVTKAYRKWLERIPQQYAISLGEAPTRRRSVHSDPASLGVVKHYRSLIPLAHEARKPTFHLRAADGALGAHSTAAKNSGSDFRKLARNIARRIDFDLKDAVHRHSAH